MTLSSQAHIDLMAMFEREFKGRRLDKEDKKIWRMERIYQDGAVNDLFSAYRKGCAYGLAVSG